MLATEYRHQDHAQLARYMGANHAFYGIIGSAILVSPPNRSSDGTWEFQAELGTVRCTAYDLLFLPNADLPASVPG